MPDETDRSEIEARVYSRAGSSEPRVDRVDPLTGRTISVTESEWRLLILDRKRAGRAGRAESAATAEPVASAAPPGSPEPPAGRSAARPRGRRVSAATFALAGVLAGVALAASWSWTGDVATRQPEVRVVISPQPVDGLEGAEGLPSGHALDVFRDPDRVNGSLPGWLSVIFPVTRVSQLIGPETPIRGAGVYAVMSHEAIACLIVRLEANGMVWNCTSVEHLVGDGMSLRTPIPAGLGGGRDDDGDGIAGDASRSDLLVVEWNADGTFDITRSRD
jgi:hypothetical protein